MGSVAKSYMRKSFLINEEYANFSPYMRRPLVIFDFATDPFQFPYIWGKFYFLFYQCNAGTIRTGAHVSFHVFRNVHEPSPEEALFMEELQYAFWQMEDQLWWVKQIRRQNSSTKFRQKSWEFSSLLFTVISLQLCLEISISSHSRNLLQFLEFIYCTL